MSVVGVKLLDQPAETYSVDATMRYFRIQVLWDIIDEYIYYSKNVGFLSAPEFLIAVLSEAT